MEEKNPFFPNANQWALKREQSLRQWMTEDTVVFKMFLTHDIGELKIALSNGTEESFDFMDDT